MHWPITWRDHKRKADYERDRRKAGSTVDSRHCRVTRARIRCLGNPELTRGSSLVSVEFFPVGVSTEIRLTHEQLPSIESRDDHAQGWSGTFDKLEKYLVS
jgi:uncharacterized protein YndB with AHSA1/START domain